MSVSDTGWFVNLQVMNHPGSGVNLVPETDSLSCEYHVRNPPASDGLWLGSKQFSESWKQAEEDAAEVCPCRRQNLHPNRMCPRTVPTMNSVLLWWAPSLNICSKLQGHSKIGKNPIRHILATWSITQSQFEKISRDTVPLKRGATTVPPKRGRLRNYLYQQALKYFLDTFFV